MTEIDEFDDWLRKGLGRAVLHLKKHKAEPFRESVLHACTHSLGYDTQCEGSREHYLWDLIQASGDEEFFREGIIRVLSSEAIDTDDFDLDQAVIIARHFAERGDVAMKAVMYRALERIPFEQACSCYEDLIKLDGVTALVAVSERFPGAMVDEYWRVNSLTNALEERDGKKSAEETIESASREYPTLRTMLEKAKQWEVDYEKEVAERPKLEYATLKERLRGEGFGGLLGWGKTASDEDIERVADDLLAETDQKLLLGYVRIFRWRRFPRAIDKILELARSTDVPMFRAAVSLLSQISDPRIRELAFEFMKESDHRGAAVDLLISNYEEGDFHRIEEALRKTHDIDDLHYLGSGVRDLFEAYSSPEAATSLLYLYEHGPCSICRSGIVQGLIALEAFPEWMREDCRFDCDDYVREIVEGESKT